MEDALHSAISKENIRVQWYVAILGVTLMAVKFIAWIITGSVAILTDAMESIVNIVAAFFGLYALYLSAKPRNLHYPYGHGKIELVSASFEGLMIIVAGSIIIMHAITHLINPEPIDSLDLGLLLVAISAIVNYVAGRFAISKGRANNSIALVSSGRHLCSDSYSSIGITLGLLLMTGFTHVGLDVWWLDPIIAMIFGTIIIVTGLKVMKGSIDGVMDRNDMEYVEKVVRRINTDRHDHWIDFHDLRITKYGSTIHIDFHIILPMDMTVKQQCQEYEELKGSIEEELGCPVDFTIMAESCSGVMCRYCKTDCVSRTMDFECLVEWDVDTVTDQDEDHTVRHICSK